MISPTNNKADKDYFFTYCLQTTFFFTPPLWLSSLLKPKPLLSSPASMNAVIMQCLSEFVSLYLLLFCALFFFLPFPSPSPQIKLKWNVCFLRELSTISNDNLLAGGTIAGTNSLYSLDNIHTLGYTAEDNVLAIEPGSLSCAKEELWTVGVRSSVSHTEDTGSSVAEGKVLISKLVAVDRLDSGGGKEETNRVRQRMSESELPIIDIKLTSPPVPLLVIMRMVRERKEGRKEKKCRQRHKSKVTA